MTHLAAQPIPSLHSWMPTSAPYDSVTAGLREKAFVGPLLRLSVPENTADHSRAIVKDVPTPGVLSTLTMSHYGQTCHCEEHSDEAIPVMHRGRLLRSLWSLAMTNVTLSRYRPYIFAEVSLSGPARHVRAQPGKTL